MPPTMATYGRFRELIRSIACTPPRITAVIGYIRVFTDEQSLGPDAQRAAIDQWSAAGVWWRASRACS